jgi:hypothetical protein
MATNERSKTTNAALRKLGILAVGASLGLAACGTSETLSGTVQTAGERQSVLRDPDNPYWSRNTATIEIGGHQSVLRDPDNPYWARNTATPAAKDAVEQRGRPH